MSGFGSNLRGIVAMCLSCLGFTLSDLFLKLASSGMPAGQILALRGFIVSLMILALLIVTGALGSLRHLTNPRVWVRAGGDLLATGSYLPALFHMPIGNAIVLLQMVPLVMTAMAALLMREQVGWRRWSAVAVGFVGVIVVARPGLDGFSAYSLLILVAVGGIVLRDVSTRSLPTGIPGLVLILATGLGSMPLGGAFGLFEHWSMPSPLGLLLVCLASTVLIGGYYMLIMAMRSGEVAVVSTFRYAFVPYAILAGFLVWGDVPDLFMLVGAALILGAGIYIANRERLRARERRRALGHAA